MSSPAGSIRRLIAAARRLGAGDFKARCAPGEPGDDLSKLARAIDRMAEALETRETDRAQEADAFAWGLAHDLRGSRFWIELPREKAPEHGA